MNYSYSSLITVGANVGNLKKNYNKQMGFYALGFRNNVFIFDSYKILVNIIHIFMLLRKAILYKCTFTGLGTQVESDEYHLLKTLFFNFNENWLFGHFIGGTLSNKKVSLWKNARWIVNYSDYYYTSELASDVYFVLNNFSVSNMLSELLNDFSFIVGVNDSNMQIDGLTHVVPYNTKSLQSFYLLTSLLEQFLVSEKKKINHIKTLRVNTSYNALYVQRLLKLRIKFYKTRFFYNAFPKKIVKKLFVYTKLMSLTAYSAISTFFKKRPKKGRYRPLKIFKPYVRNVMRSYMRNVFFKRWSFSVLRSFVDIFWHQPAKVALSTNFLKFNVINSFSTPFRLANFFVKNKRSITKRFDWSMYKYFLHSTIKAKRLRVSSIFYRNPRFAHLYLMRGDYFSATKNLVYLTRKKFQRSKVLTPVRFFKKHKIFYSLMLPREWIFYRKNNKFAKKALESLYISFPDKSKHLRFNIDWHGVNWKKHQRQRHAQFKKRFKKRFNPNYTPKKNPYRNLQRDQGNHWRFNADGSPVGTNSVPNNKQRVSKYYNSWKINVPKPNNLTNLPPLSLEPRQAWSRTANEKPKKIKRPSDYSVDKRYSRYERPPFWKNKNKNKPFLKNELVLTNQKSVNKNDMSLKKKDLVSELLNKGPRPKGLNEGKKPWIMKGPGQNSPAYLAFKEAIKKDRESSKKK